MKPIDAYFFQKSVNRKTGKLNYIRYGPYNCCSFATGKVCILHKREVTENDPEIVLVVRGPFSHIDKKDKCDVFRGFKEVKPEPLTKEDIVEISACCGDATSHKRIGIANLGDGEIVADAYPGHAIYFKVDGDLFVSLCSDTSMLEVDRHHPKLHTHAKAIVNLPMDFREIARASRKISRIFVKDEYRVIEFASDKGKPVYGVEKIFPTIKEVDFLDVSYSIVDPWDVDCGDPWSVRIKLYDKNSSECLNLSEFDEITDFSDIAWFMDPAFVMRNVIPIPSVTGDVPELVVEAIKLSAIGVGAFEETGSQCAYILDRQWFYYLKDEDRQTVLDFLYSMNVVGREKSEATIKRRVANIGALNPTSERTLNACRDIARFYELYNE